jgi:uncharacterized protein YndB with AHSA1/START domain
MILQPTQNVQNIPIVQEVILKATVSEVWNALTDKGEMRKWYFDLDEFAPEEGFEFQFIAGEEGKTMYKHICRIISVIPHEKLVYSWRYEGYRGDSEVRFEIFAEKDHTRLKLTHAGLESFPEANPDFAKENFEAGWTQILNDSLKHYLENS